MKQNMFFEAIGAKNNDSYNSIKEKYEKFIKNCNDREFGEKIKKYWNENKNRYLNLERQRILKNDTKMVERVLPEENESNKEKEVNNENTAKPNFKLYLKGIKKAVTSKSFLIGVGTGLGLGIISTAGFLGAPVLATAANIRLGYALGKFGLNIISKKIFPEKRAKIIKKINKFTEKHKKNKLIKSAIVVNGFLKKPSTQYFLNGFSLGISVGHLATEMFYNNPSKGQKFLGPHDTVYADTDASSVTNKTTLVTDNSNLANQNGILNGDSLQANDPLGITKDIDVSSTQEVSEVSETATKSVTSHTGLGQEDPLGLLDGKEMGTTVETSNVQTPVTEKVITSHGLEMDDPLGITKNIDVSSAQGVSEVSETTTKSVTSHTGLGQEDPLGLLDSSNNTTTNTYTMDSILNINLDGNYDLSNIDTVYKTSSDAVSVENGIKDIYKPSMSNLHVGGFGYEGHNISFEKVQELINSGQASSDDFALRLQNKNGIDVAWTNYDDLNTINNNIRIKR